MNPFSWTTDADAAKKEQIALRDLVNLTRTDAAPATFDRGLAIGTAYDENTKTAVATALPFGPDGRYEKHKFSAEIEVDFPYVPGLLAFRVGPAVCKLLDELPELFDLLLFDGQGVAHPRGIGLATHIGILYDKMSIGITRNRLFGDALELPTVAGIASPIHSPSTRECVGYSLIPSGGCPAIFISPGHRLNPAEALEIVRGISRSGACFPTCLARAHGMANSAARQVWRRSGESGTMGAYDE